MDQAIKENQTKNLKKKTRGNKAPKENKQFIQIFMCTCGKSYYSFPALYLHNKTKHQTTIRACQKETMTKRKVWSGKKKKIIYEFPQESEVEEEFSEIILRKSQKVSKHKKREKFRTHETHPASLERKNNIKHILQQFIHDSQIYIKEFQFWWIKLICQQFQNCLNMNYKNIFSISTTFNDYCLENTCEMIPDSFNYFVVQYLEENKVEGLQNDQKVSKFLLRLSNWLYEKKYTENIIVPNENYQRSLN